MKKNQENPSKNFKLQFLTVPHFEMERRTSKKQDLKSRIQPKFFNEWYLFGQNVNAKVPIRDEIHLIYRKNDWLKQK